MVTGQEPRPGRSRSGWLVSVGLAVAAMSLVTCSKEQVPAQDGARTEAASPAPAVPRPLDGDLSQGTGEFGSGRVAPAPGLTLRGTVVDLEGKPLPEVAVRVSAVDGASEPGGKAPRTDAQGRFEIAGAPTGRVRILVAAPRGGATEYNQALLTTQVGGGAIVELAPIRLARRKVKAGEAAGDLGYALQEARPGADPQARKFIVAAVRPGGPGELAGLRVGDEIVAVNGEDVTGERRYLYPQLVNVPPGEVLKLGLAGGRTVEVTTTAPP